MSETYGFTPLLQFAEFPDYISQDYQFILDHRGADEIVVDIETKRPHAAVYRKGTDKEAVFYRSDAFGGEPAL